METAFAAFTAFLVAALPLAVGVTKVVDLIRNLIDPSGKFPKAVWSAVAILAGIGLALGWGFNLFEPLIAAIPALEKSGLATGEWAEVATGIAIGGMAGFWHERLDEWSSRAKAERPAA